MNAATATGLLSRREWQSHPWRYAVIVLALALGVALAWSVHLINASALAEFAAAVRTTQGEADASLRGANASRGPEGGLADAWLDRIAAHPQVGQAIGVVEFDTYARLQRVDAARAEQDTKGDSAGPAAAPVETAPQDNAGADVSPTLEGQRAQRVSMRVIGLDALAAPTLAPSLVPRLERSGDPLALVDPARVFLNGAAMQVLRVRAGDTIVLQAGPRWVEKIVGGSIAAGGSPLAVIDIAAAQDDFGFAGRVSRIDVRLVPGASVEGLRLELPPGAAWARADDGAQRVSNLSRAYRVNLMVLALVALLVGAFMAYSVIALAVAQRTPAFALLGVLGMTARERRALVLRECIVLGAVGSMVGLALGTLLASWVLRRLGGDLGGGYFPGVTPSLRIEPWAALAMFALGVAAAAVGGFVPSRQAQQLLPAQALKGMGDSASRAPTAWPAMALLVLAMLLAMSPPVAGLPLAAYASVACLLFGGVALVPWFVDALLRLVRTPRSAVGLLALRRAHFHRRTATAVVAGVVASLALSVALTVMVGSFRVSVRQWLDQVLPADLYMRTASSSMAADQAWLDAAFESRALGLAGVRTVEASRSRALSLSPDRPSVMLIARRLGTGDDIAARLPLLGALDAKPAGGASDSAAVADVAGTIDAYVSEAIVTLYGKGVGSSLDLPLVRRDGAPTTTVRVRGVWRDFARQFGAIAVDLDDYRRVTGDTRLNDLALWLLPNAELEGVQAGLRALASDGATAAGVGAANPESSMIEFATTTELRRLSLEIFDRSFAVTRYLQVVAIGIGLVGIAAGLSAQVLARRREFGLLEHLGLTRGQRHALVALETLAWLAAGVVVGVALGLAIGAVLVHVVNPQSFHWTMTMHVPWPTLATLALAVLSFGSFTAWLATRAASSVGAVRAVREDW